MDAYTIWQLQQLVASMHVSAKVNRKIILYQQQQRDADDSYHTVQT